MAENTPDRPVDPDRERVGSRPAGSETEAAKARDMERAAERRREVEEARHHTRSAGVSRTATGDPVIEHTGFRLSWGGIIAGLVIVLVLQIFFMLVGVAVGFGIADPVARPDEVGMGLGIWAAVSSLLALFLGGLAAGRLAGVLTPGDGALHGVLVWGTSTIVTLWLVAAGVTGLIGGTLDLATSPVAAEAAAHVDPAEAEARGEGVMEDVQRQVERVDTREAADTAGQAAGWALLAMGLGMLAAAGGAAVTARS